MQTFFFSMIDCMCAALKKTRSTTLIIFCWNFSLMDQLPRTCNDNFIIVQRKFFPVSSFIVANFREMELRCVFNTRAHHLCSHISFGDFTHVHFATFAFSRSCAYCDASCGKSGRFPKLSGKQLSSGTTVELLA